MKSIIAFLVVLFFFSHRLNAQTHTIYGRVVSEDLEPIPFILIKDQKSITIGKTGMDGRFKISVPQNTQALSFVGLGYEPANIKLTGDCDTVEVVMMEGGSYDFISSRKIDRIRLSHFKKLPECHFQAYQKGLFTKPANCYTREFEPDKPAIDSIQKEIDKKAKVEKEVFKKLKIGDTIKMPFYTPHSASTADTIRLQCSAWSSGGNSFDCMIKGVILRKNRHKKGYNLVFKVTDRSLCKSPAIFENKPMKVGEVFTYNMRFFKILTQ